MADLDLNNLTLQDNNFDTVPEGDYHIKVVSHEVGYYQPKGTESKIPAGTQQIILHIEIPFGDGNTAKVKHTQNVYAKTLFALRQITDCLGISEEKGVFKFNINDLDGKSGIAKVGVQTGNNGQDYNKIDTFYAPSKAPTVTANDEAWKKYNEGFVPSTDEIPFT